MISTGCTALNGGCVFTPDATFWSALVNYARGGPAVTYTVKGVNGASPGAVGTTLTRTLRFSDQDLTSGIYYWNTSGIVQRYDWGLPNSHAETWMDASSAGATYTTDFGFRS